MTELFTATVSGESIVFIVDECSEPGLKGKSECFRRLDQPQSEGNHFHATSFTDLTPVSLYDPATQKVVDKGCMVIDLKDYGHIALGEFEDLFRFLGKNFQNGWVKNIRNQIALQLTESPSADEEIVHRCPPSGESLTPCCGKTPFELSRTSRITVDDSLVTCKPTATYVTIELTEEDLELADTICISDFVDMYGQKTMQLPERLADKLYSQLTPPMSEPKELVWVVSVCNCENEAHEFIKVRKNGLWFAFDDEDYSELPIHNHTWDDIKTGAEVVSPTRIEVEG